MGPKSNRDYQCRVKQHDLLKYLSHCLSQEQWKWFSSYYTEENLLSTEEITPLVHCVLVCLTSYYLSCVFQSYVF